MCALCCVQVCVCVWGCVCVTCVHCVVCRMCVWVCVCVCVCVCNMCALCVLGVEVGVGALLQTKTSKVHGLDVNAQTNGSSLRASELDFPVMVGVGAVST